MPSIEEFVDAGLAADGTLSLDQASGNMSTTEEVIELPRREQPAEEEDGFDRVTDIFDAGMKCETMRLYPKRDAYGNTEWADEIPAKIMDQAYGYGEAWKEYAVLLRTNIDQGRLRLHSIVIQSPLLKEKLNSCFDEYPGFYIGEDKSSVIEAPFTAFVQCWDAFVKACDEETETAIETRKHMDLLRSALEPELQESFSIIKAFHSNGMIRFDQLWMVFKPGCFLYQEYGGVERVFKLARTELHKGTDGHGRYLLLHCYFVDWDGGMYGHSLGMDAIENFEGGKKYEELGIYPLDVHPEKDSVIKRLVERGRKFSSYTGVHYKSYDGLASALDGGFRHADEHVSLFLYPPSTSKLNVIGFWASGYRY